MSMTTNTLSMHLHRDDGVYGLLLNRTSLVFSLSINYSLLLTFSRLLHLHSDYCCILVAVLVVHLIAVRFVVVAVVASVPDPVDVAVRIFVSNKFVRRYKEETVFRAEIGSK